ELVPPSKLDEGRVAETRRMFQSAWPASYMPALRPTRGSGMGDMDVLDIVLDIVLDVEPAQAADISAAATTAVRRAIRTCWSNGIVNSSVNSCWKRVKQASAPCARSRSSDPR